MGKKLFITEKPSVARDFIKALKVKGNNGKGYIEGNEAVFTWCVGHMVTMSYPGAYDDKYKKWALKDLPFMPQDYKYEVIPNVEDQFNVVKHLLKRPDIDTVYVCTDSGREGEYIYRLVEQMVGVEEKDRKRVWIDSQTEEEIKRGIREAKDLTQYDNLSDSAYLRAKEDYLLGINFSRLLTLIYGRTMANLLDEKRGVVAVGRVMSCVLAMIVEKDREFRNFKKTSFYKLSSDFSIQDGTEYTGEWKAVEGSKYFESPLLYNDTGFKKKKNAEGLLKVLEAHASVEQPHIEKVNKKNEKKNAPLLFNLAELQNECSKRFKINPEGTLKNLQTLYEKKLVTYPRTDARVLSKAVSKEIKKNLGKLKSFKTHPEVQKHTAKILEEEWYKGLEKTKYVDDKKITDHYAIIPTGEGHQTINSLKKTERAIYDLIVKRFLAIFYPPAQFSKVSVTTRIGEERFFTTDKVCVALGYLEVLEPEKQSNRSKDGQSLHKLRKGQKLQLDNIEIKEGKTSPPKRYTSGTIILAMENAGKLIEDEALREHIKGAGIGTSATRAGILKKLESIGYINTNKKTQVLTPTVKGEMIYEIVNDAIPSLLNPKLTASWEKGLKMIVDGDITKDVFMEKLEKYIGNNIQKALHTNYVIDVERLFSHIFKESNMTIDQEAKNKIIGLCPVCKEGHIVKNSKGYGCSAWKKGCQFFVGTICDKVITPGQVKKLIQNGRTDVIKGFKSKKGTTFSAQLTIKEGKVTFDF